MSEYTIQNKSWVIGSDSASATLTASFADNVAHIPTGFISVVELNISYTPGEDAAVLHMQIETGDSKDDVYKMTSSEIISDIDNIKLLPGKFAETVTNGTNYKFAKTYRVNNLFLRISFREVATSHGTLVVKAITSG